MRMAFLIGNGLANESCCLFELGHNLRSHQQFESFVHVKAMQSSAKSTPTKKTSAPSTKKSPRLNKQAKRVERPTGMLPTCPYVV